MGPGDGFLLVGSVGKRVAHEKRERNEGDHTSFSRVHERDRQISEKEGNKQRQSINKINRQLYPQHLASGSMMPTISPRIMAGTGSADGRRAGDEAVPQSFDVDDSVM